VRNAQVLVLFDHRRPPRSMRGVTTLRSVIREHSTRFYLPTGSAINHIPTLSKCNANFSTYAVQAAVLCGSTCTTAENRRYTVKTVKTTIKMQPSATFRKATAAFCRQNYLENYREPRLEPHKWESGISRYNDLLFLTEKNACLVIGKFCLIWRLRNVA